MESLGERIKARRKELSWSLRDLAAETGLSASFLSEVERGLRGVGADSLLAIATAIGIPMDQLTRGANGQAVKAGAAAFPPRLQQWAFDANIPYRHASCLYWCARTILDHRRAHERRGLDDWDWVKFYDALKPWLED